MEGGEDTHSPSPHPLRATPRTGKTFPTAPTDWQWQYPSVPSTLRGLHSQGFRLYLLSNQKGISTKGVRLTYAELTARVSAVVAALGLPDGARVEGFFATHDNIFYKPRPGMGYLLEDAYVLVLLYSCVFVLVGSRGKQNPRRINHHYFDGSSCHAIGAGTPTASASTAQPPSTWGTPPAAPTPPGGRRTTAMGT